MPANKRYKTNYPGVFYIFSQSTQGRPEKIYYIRYKKNGKLVEEKAGRQFQDDMTPARAATIRGQRVEGKQQSNKEKREQLLAKKKTEQDKWTISRLWKEYKNNTPNSKNIVNYESIFRVHLEKKFGEKEPHEIHQFDLTRYRKKLSQTKAPKTINNIFELLRRIINFGINNNFCKKGDYNIKLSEVNNEKTEDLTDRQLVKLLDVLDNEVEREDTARMMKLALFTGMRKGEILKLKNHHIDFNRGFIKIKDPKGGKDQQIPISSEVKKLLKTALKKYPDSEYVFPGKNGKSLRVDAKKSAAYIRDKAGLPKNFRPFHGLRHVFASMLASSGEVDIYTLQRLLTHKSPKMTQRYAHLRDEALKRGSAKAVDLISEVRERAKKKKASEL